MLFCQFNQLINRRKGYSIIWFVCCLVVDVIIHWFSLVVYKDQLLPSFSFEEGLQSSLTVQIAVAEDGPKTELGSFFFHLGPFDIFGKPVC